MTNERKTYSPVASVQRTFRTVSRQRHNSTDNRPTMLEMPEQDSQNRTQSNRLVGCRTSRSCNSNCYCFAHCFVLPVLATFRNTFGVTNSFANNETTFIMNASSSLTESFLPFVLSIIFEN